MLNTDPYGTTHGDAVSQHYNRVNDKHTPIGRSSGNLWQRPSALPCSVTDGAEKVALHMAVGGAPNLEGSLPHPLVIVLAS